jgi:hypothetical protein
VREALQHTRTKPHVQCVREMLTALKAVEGPMPRQRAALVEALVLHILSLDLDDFERNARGVVWKKRLPKHALEDAVQAWRDYHKSGSHVEACKALAPSQSYALLWNAFKRFVLN